MLEISDEPPLFDPRRQTQTLFKVQLYFCSILGLVIFLTFCLVRYKFPLLYSVRPYRNKMIRRLPKSFLGWLKVLHSISGDEIIQVAGLDAYVFLCFFRMGIRIFFTMTVAGLLVLSPVRYLLTGKFDKEMTGLQLFYGVMTGSAKTAAKHDDSEPTGYLVVCTIFTYIFTATVFFFLFKETLHIIKTRQRCLGSQRSVTDRTIVISHIPDSLKNEEALKSHIETLGVGNVEKVTLVYDYTKLRILFDRRAEIVHKLEQLYSNYYGLEIRIFKDVETPSAKLKLDLLSQELDLDASVPLPKAYDSKKREKKRPTGRITAFGPKVDLFDYYCQELIQMDQNIKVLREKGDFKPIPSAFVTMDSVSDAQMAAQAVFSPKAFQLITCLAPAPLDVNWDNLHLSSKSVFIRKNIVELIIIAFSILLIIPIRYLSSLLNVNAIKRIWPEFGDYLIKHEILRTIVTGILPTYLFTLINIALPYVISFLSNLQGLVSKGDVDLSITRKNFMYIFFNLFLVFTLFGTLSSYKALLSDTTKIAPLLATSIKSLSLFYIDLILLQGLVMFPVKLLQAGDLAYIFWEYVLRHSWQTPRSYRDLFYKPAMFEVGLILPQHLLIFIITIIYSVISTKILTSGLVYFVLGYYVYKYQLVYSMVHPYHSTGKLWPIVFHRVCLGMLFFQLQMLGTLALEQSFVLAALVVPLLPTTVVVILFFNRNYLPLLFYIALDAIKTSGESAETDDSDELGSFLGSPDGAGRKPRSGRKSVVMRTPSESPSPSHTDPEALSAHVLRKRRSTIDEAREACQSYIYPLLKEQLDGPWVGFEGDDIDVVRYYATESQIVSDIVRQKVSSIEYD
ncbi:hypothetical protein KL918_003126 [Ogataea parapolymorpha]|uniref:Calcium permeable stress-gated cation channel 1 n=1 Tax=Ogataea parapolymorpha (strain ATCC 26012 / BCRC 20466 / JCM 22074 / NRRL Y-7560 / DL-1) TaxID=871575 RepID=W1QDH1_OGAPD|nr:hypothetical protein HPODL_01833 [Ogataea parapolymorpha DL-1]ESW97747.1 hypothetical protein HPODL_01833 [Ogataea parapolymorpha DL-1]KAG7866931.1 hypothetical protein KL918_003126 [Ogataea parapolymorpha]KAG7871261.1 hypothetical protein KL916_004260 [Ogataea parapolymorpha]